MKDIQAPLGSLITIAEAADRLNVSASTVRLWIKEGRLTPVRMGVRIVRIRELDLSGLYSQKGPAR